MSQTGDPEVHSAQGRHNLLSLCGIAIELALRRHPESPPLCPDTSAGSTPVDSDSPQSSGISRVGVGVVSEGWGQRRQKGEHAAGTVGMGGKSLTTGRNIGWGGAARCGRGWLVSAVALVRPQGLQEPSCLRNLQRPSEDRGAPFPAAELPRSVWSSPWSSGTDNPGDAQRAMHREWTEPRLPRLTDLGETGKGPSGLKPQQPRTVVSGLLHKLRTIPGKTTGQILQPSISPFGVSGSFLYILTWSSAGFMLMGHPSEGISLGSLPGPLSSQLRVLHLI